MSHTVVYLDMDEVIKDFRSAALRGAGVDLTDPEVRRVLIADDWHAIEALCGGRAPFCAPVDRGGRAYWEAMETMPWAVQLIEAIQATGVPIVVVTSPSFWPENAPVKIRQITEEFGLPYCLCADKHLLASPTKLLVDDAKHNVDRFVAAGGRAVRWPNRVQIEDGVASVEASIALVVDTIRRMELGSL